MQQKRNPAVASITFVITLGDKKPLHFTNNFILPLDKTVVIGVGEHDDSTVWNFFAKVFNLLLHILPATAQKRFHSLPSWVRQRLNKIQ